MGRLDLVSSETLIWQAVAAQPSDAWRHLYCNLNTSDDTPSPLVKTRPPSMKYPR